MIRRHLLCTLLLTLAGLLPVAAHDAQGAQAPRYRNWLCYYGTDFGPAHYGRFDLVVLDGMKHPPLERKEPGKPLLLGYVTVGESDPSSPTWMLAQHQSFIAGKNENWGSLIIDMRSPKWQGILLDLVIPKVLAQGFDGIFLDTIDSAMALAEGKDAAKYEGMRASILGFLRTIRERFPDIHICMNRGLDLLPDAAPIINSLLIEDLSFEYDFEKKEYRAVPKQVQQALVAAARRGLAANPELTVLTLDYAKPDQKARIKEAIDYSRSKGFVPYVSTLALDQVFYHTLDR
ncbi:MAG: endo alpha-1,4 polygalactosaminidase [Humidesulfovibrio sp.]|uniref:endo alpha-1,4 polygalactosaminidase n=1 Tax=Humidesulfovibrio sp. TaxID=2910988 RepID=UPI0027F5DADA|nr:endo alpha-1,4 polygalactosaminidase [Humidesulfovibrio sp.]MDQ7833787.1 endo alpha-1,4 polygalactosaminidase [Humidesulfovibrio sp.]